MADTVRPHKAAALHDARDAHLRYISDEQVPGITRQGRPNRFHYRTPSGAIVRDKSTLRRIKKLAIPPAWNNVWIAPFPNAHLVATGRDAMGRKQYRYHPDFTAIRDTHKYDHLVRFAAGLPALRRRLKQDLKRKGLPREKILAAIVTLLEETLIRVGNEGYVHDNQSYGLTTLRNRHVSIKGETLKFVFKGKSGKSWNLSICDRRVAGVLRACQDLPGQHLFEWRDDGGGIHAISSTDVNAYLRDVTGEDVSAKDFRTWAGTVRAAMGFSHVTGAANKAVVKSVIAEVAERLGNTVAICRKCYIHPDIISGFEDGAFVLRKFAARGGLNGHERAVLAYLKQKKKSAKSRAKAAL